MAGEEEQIKTVCIFEDEKFPNFFPLSVSQPTFDLRIGGSDFRTRLHVEAKAENLSLLCRDYLAPVVALKDPDVAVNEVPRGDVVFLNGRLLCYGQSLKELLERVPQNSVAMKGGEVAAARLSEKAVGDFVDYLRGLLSDEVIDRVCAQLKSYGEGDTAPAVKVKKKPAKAGEPSEGTSAPAAPDEDDKIPQPLLKLIDKHSLTRTDLSEARIISYPWQIIEENPAVIDDDFQKSPFRGQSEESIVYPGAHMVGEENIVVGQGAVIKPGAVLDASSGPIVINDGTMVMPNAALVGPVYVGKNCAIKAGAKILEGTSIGDVCKVGGEVDQSIFAAYSNKQHDGFIGHSYIGEWVNIGASATNSDLKNNYSAVRMWSAGVVRETGRQFLGIIMGDHTKTGIGTLFNSGTVVGFNCNVFGSDLVDKFVPSFSWGRGSEMSDYEFAKAVLTAQVVMERRNVKFADEYRKYFEKIYEMSGKSGRNM